jgi:uncharacterized membrane protein affecting hemolysin expression
MMQETGMRFPQATTRWLMVLAAFIGLVLALVIQERRASRLATELTSTNRKLQYYHEFSRKLAFDLLRSEEALKTVARAKVTSP